MIALVTRTGVGFGGLKQRVIHPEPGDSLVYVLKQGFQSASPLRGALSITEVGPGAIENSAGNILNES